MRSRYLPYATRPGRLIAQLISDLTVIVWVVIWVAVGAAVHTAIATIADVGQQVESGARGVAGNLNSAGNNADDIPLVGHTLSKPLRAETLDEVLKTWLGIGSRQLASRAGRLLLHTYGS